MDEGCGWRGWLHQRHNSIMGPALRHPCASAPHLCACLLAHIAGTLSPCTASPHGRYMSEAEMETYLIRQLQDPSHEVRRWWAAARLHRSPDAHLLPCPTLSVQLSPPPPQHKKYLATQPRIPIPSRPSRRPMLTLRAGRDRWRGCPQTSWWERSMSM